MELDIGGWGVPQYRDGGQGWNDSLEELQLLAGDLGQIEEHPGDVAAGPGQRLHEAASHRITLQIDTDDRHGAGRASRRLDGRRATGHDHVDLLCQQISDQRGKPFFLSVRVDNLNRDVLPVHVSSPSQPRLKFLKVHGRAEEVGGQIGDPRHPFLLLCPYSERRSGSCEARQQEPAAAHHSMT
jgi:hypothetical protein